MEEIQIQIISTLNFKDCKEVKIGVQEFESQNLEAEIREGWEIHILQIQIVQKQTKVQTLQTTT